MERLNAFYFVLAIFIFLLGMGYHRQRRGNIVWHWLTWIVNNILWIAYVILSTRAAYFSVETSRAWFTLTYFQLFVTIILDWAVLNRDNSEIIRKLIGVK